MGLIGLVVCLPLVRVGLAILANPAAAISDFRVYQDAAAAISRHADPYAYYLAPVAGDPTRTGHYVYPPLLAWALRPLVQVSPLPLDIMVTLALGASLGLAIWLLAEALEFGNRRLVAAFAIATIAYFPVIQNFVWGQLNLLLLLLEVLWLRSWIGGGWRGGLALGAAISLKLLQVPCLALVAWRRRTASLVAALAMVALLSLAASPRLLPEYVLRVLPQIGGSTGWIANMAPYGTIARLIDPQSLYGLVRPPAWASLGAGLAGLGVIATTWAVLPRRAGSREARGLEAAAAIAVVPLVSSLDWPAHMVLVLPTFAVAGWWAMRRGDRTVGWMVVAAWLLTGPVSEGLWGLLDGGRVGPGPILRVLVELPAMGVWLTWLATLIAIRRQAASDTHCSAAGNGGAGPLLPAGLSAG
ncbi:MAG: glycosyltransferase 87 family protein [Candidatus Dormibacteraceae bacterium]